MNRRNFIKGLLSTATVVALAPLAPVVEFPVAEAKFVSFDEIARITLEKYRPVFAKAILESEARFRWESLYARDCIEGGKSLREPIFLNSV